MAIGESARDMTEKVPQQAQGGGARKTVRLLVRAAAHPRRAARAALRALQDATDDDPQRRYRRAMRLLTGLDVDLRLERGDLVWLLPPSNDGISRSLFVEGAYSGAELSAVREFMRATRRDKRWFIDAGANIGTTTVPMARAGYRVLAIEAVPSTVRYLKANIVQNNVSDLVTIIEGAISERPEVFMALNASPGQSEVVTALDDPPTFGRSAWHQRTISVPGFGLDRCVQDAGIEPESVALVWADIQGSEIELIKSGCALWEARVPLYMEFWPLGLEKSGGVVRLVAEAAPHFSEFVESTALVAGQWDPKPLAGLHQLGSRTADYTDVLLLSA